jgi:hypothetical protein
MFGHPCTYLSAIAHSRCKAVLVDQTTLTDDRLTVTKVARPSLDHGFPTTRSTPEIVCSAKKEYRINR